MGILEYGGVPIRETLGLAYLLMEEVSVKLLQTKVLYAQLPHLVLYIDKIAWDKVGPLAKHGDIITQRKTGLHYGLILQEAYDSGSHTTMIEPKEKASVTSGNLQKGDFVLLSPGERGAGLGVYAQYVTVQQVIHCLAGLSFGIDGDDATLEQSSRQVADGVLIVFIEYGLHLAYLATRCKIRKKKGNSSANWEKIANFAYNYHNSAENGQKKNGT